jgi:predicted nucleotide-binding protein
MATAKTARKKVASDVKATEPTQPSRSKRAYLSQADVPGCTLEDALRVPQAIAENYAAKPTSPLNTAAALDMQPNAGRFRLLCGAALAYGLTSGGPNAPEIAITPLGMRAVRPTQEGDDRGAQREALMRPRVIGEFLQKYNNAPLPRPDIAVNVLLEMGVPRERAEETLEFILQGASGVGLLREIKGKKYVDLAGVSAPDKPEDEETDDEVPLQERVDTAERDESDEGQKLALNRQASLQRPSQTQNRRVFITHGKNKSLIEPIKKLLGFGELEPVVSVEKMSISQPVPDKVMNDMRSCGSAIIHVDAEQTLIDREANEQVVLNPNVLIEIGAAMALYGRRFILLVRDGIKLPSNLQGLFEVRYSGENLDGDATIKLLEAINDIKNHPLPDRY